MKKTAILILTVCMLFIYTNSCSSKSAIDDLSQTDKIEIRVYSTDGNYTDYVIWDKETVQSICSTFSSLELKKVRITKPLEAAYTLGFFKSRSAAPIEYITLTSEKNVIDCNENLYRITSEMNIHDFVADAVANIPNEDIDTSLDSSEAVDIALEHCNTNYDYIVTTYDSVTGEWQVGFWENGAKLAAQKITLDKDGNVIYIWFAE